MVSNIKILTGEQELKGVSGHKYSKPMLKLTMID